MSYGFWMIGLLISFIMQVYFFVALSSMEASEWVHSNFRIYGNCSFGLSMAWLFGGVASFIIRYYPRSEIKEE